MTTTETLLPQARSAAPSVAGSYMELTKPGIVTFIMLAAATGYFMAPGEIGSVFHFINTVLGTGLTAAGAAAFNQYVERLPDAQMERTAHRPLPSGRVSSRAALIFGLLLTVLGLAPLVLFVGWLTALLAAVSWVAYVFVYTPLKRRTPLCTLVGAVPGALPIVAGWSARASIAELAPWTLFALMFCWQIPHFLSLAWLYRAEYAKAGFRMITSFDPIGRRTSRVSLVFAGLLAVATTLPFGIRIAHGFYGVTAPLVGLLFFAVAAGMRPGAMETGARRLFLMSLVYLPTVFSLLLLDRFYLR